MDTASSNWWRRHGLTVALLLSAFGIALLIRTVFMAQVIELWGPLNVYGGGSDSFYHSRVMQYIVDNHHNLVRDPLLNYPIGAVNPREPLFDWMNAILGILFAPFFGGDAVKAGAWFLSMGGPIWAALGVFPVYLIGREVTSRRAGIIAAFIYPLLVANIDSSTFGYANYLAFYTFFILLTIYGYLRTLKAVGSHRWVSSYRSPRAILQGLRSFLRTERMAVKWAVFTGVSFGTLALAWQGYTYFVAIVVIFLAVALIIERIRKVDSFGMYVATWIIGLIGFPLATPYYVPQGLFNGWFDLPLLLYFGALAIFLPFVLLRDSPWVVSIPVLAGVAAAAIGALYFVSRTFFLDIVTGQGYFVKTLVYSTVAEAQAPSIDQLILGYGIATFFLAFVGLALFVLETVRARYKRTQLVFLVFAIMSIYLPVSAAKFFFLGSAAFALLPGIAIGRLLDVGGYGELRRTVASLSDQRSRLAAFRRAFKARHVLVLLLVVGIVLPNVWYAVDAGIPYNLKGQYNLQVYNTLPPPLRTSPQNSSSFYLGAAGTQLDTPDQYDEDGYNWLAQQDLNVPPPQRPAFVSWWDYGFQAVAQGGHPTVADNFQNGIDPAGNFLLAQNESLAIGVLTTRLLTAEQGSSGQPYLPSGLNRVLASDGVNLSELHTLLVNTSTDVGLVLAHPERYLPVDASHLDPTNAQYDTVSYFLASTLSPDGVAQVYNDVQSYSGWSIRYAMVDSRLFPSGGTSTGIYYAPADLTDRIIGPGGLPTTYFSVSVVGSDGNSYPLGQVPAGVLATNYVIHYYAPFYNSMIYRIFSGYNGSDVGQSDGIPGLQANPGVSNPIQGDPVMPGWMLQHFQVVYRTAYYCPYANPSDHPGCYRAMNAILAQKLAKLQNGTASNDPGAYYGAGGGGGETILEYYAGQPMTGTITLPDGTPVANARVTVYDAWGIPHMTSLTGPTGVYSVILPPGNDTVNVTNGVLNRLNQAGSTNLLSLHVYVPPSVGFSARAPTFVRPVVLSPSTVQGFVYWNAGNNSSYLPHIDPIVPGATVHVWSGGGASRTAVTDASGAFQLSNLPAGVYNMSVTVQKSNFTQAQIFLGAGQTHNATTGLSPGELAGKVFIPSGGFGAAGATVTVSGTSGVVAVAVTNITGTFRFSNLGPGNYSVSASLSTQGLGTVAHSVDISKVGARVAVNLTLTPVTTIDLTVLYAGNPVPAFPVRFTPLGPLIPALTSPKAPNATGGPGSPPGPPGSGPSGPTNPATTAGSNSTVLFTDANGEIRTTIPYGNYSIYGLGLTSAGLAAGFASAYLPAGRPYIPLAPLVLGAAIRLSGNAGAAGPNNAVTKVYAFTARGDSVSTLANTSGGYVLYLPAGNYSLLAIQSSTSVTTAPPSAALANVSLTYSTTLNLVPAAGVPVHLRVGALTGTGGPGFFPAGGALVRFALTSGWQATAVADASGNVSIALPALPPAGASYCIRAQAIGFLPLATCGLTAEEISVQTQLQMTLQPVPVSLTISGAPGSTSLTVNFTAVSSTARSGNATGGPTFALTLNPGVYQITAWGPTSPGLWRPSTPVNTTIPLGAQSFTIGLRVYHQVASHGALVLPTGLTNNSVVVHLLSNQGNYTVAGNAFERNFLAPSGSYTVYASGTTQNSSGGPSESGRVTYATLTSVQINATGTVTPSVALTAPAASLTGNLTLPSGAVLNATVGFDLIAAGNLSVPTVANAGFFTSVLPANTTFEVVVNTTQLIPVGNGTRYEVLTTAPGSTCRTGYPASVCNVPLLSTALETPVTGSIVLPGFPGIVEGSVEFVGPLPGTGATSVSTVNGTFSAELVPGSYELYATAGGSASPLANLSLITVAATPAAPVVVRLASTWTDTLTVLAPVGASVGAVTVTITGPGGVTLTLPDFPLGSSRLLALPSGLYTIHAGAEGSSYGVPSSATAQASVYLVAGNAATSLQLTYREVTSVSVTVLPPTSMTIPGGGTAVFNFVARNVGNVPATVHFVGSPVTWNFSFHPANATLGVAAGNSSVSGWVSVIVPAGTLATPPSAEIQPLLANGTLAGPAAGMQINVDPFLRFLAGPASGSVVAPTSGSIDFWMVNLGNVPVQVAVTVQNSIVLAGLGWTTSIAKGSTTLTGSLTIPAQSNQTFVVQLKASGAAVYPTAIDLVLTATNGSLSSTVNLALSVPRVTVSLNSTGIGVTGPNLGSPSPYPDWLVPLLAFLPAIALVVGLVTYRWWRTRRWSRR
ncbi:MAG TPA: carboxypeptidase regulatory-like domain-containing protein [Thermoplasmata archaeon]|nr:carboxypeptidase regulatory-like domain-containing protein [Thermoplasmata archaeon]